jgi:hypothetical protein
VLTLLAAVLALSELLQVSTYPSEKGTGLFAAANGGDGGGGRGGAGGAGGFGGFFSGGFKKGGGAGRSSSGSGGGELLQLFCVASVPTDTVSSQAIAFAIIVAKVIVRLGEAKEGAMYDLISTHSPSIHTYIPPPFHHNDACPSFIFEIATTTNNLHLPNKLNGGLNGHGGLLPIIR